MEEYAVNELPFGSSRWDSREAEGAEVGLNPCLIFWERLHKRKLGTGTVLYCTYMRAHQSIGIRPGVFLQVVSAA